MQFFVRNLNGKTITVEANPSDPLKKIKLQIQQKEHVPVEEQIISYQSRELKNDNSSIANLNLLPNSTLQLSLSLRGGGAYDRTDPKLVQLAKNYIWIQLICRKCYARVSEKSKNCRKCGSSDLRKRSLMLSKPL
uniref:Ubiquitin-ribosomal protein eL40 fusion protein n=2 Tax=Meloidogyne incognita group TaxID=654580 RepID=A0A915NA65_MELJA